MKGTILLLGAAQACDVTVWSDIFHGREARFGDGEYNYWQFVQHMENDAISSLQVEGKDCVAVLYGGANFDDWSAHFPEGRYDLEAALAKGMHDNEASSMRVGYGQQDEHCRDNAGWTDQFGHGCKDYIKDGHCAGGHVLHDWVKEHEFRFPHHNCCACGGGMHGGDLCKDVNCRDIACMDTRGWKDGFGHGCEGYVNDGKCGHGQVNKEAGYIKEKAEFKQPHQNCCACGK